MSNICLTLTAIIMICEPPAIELQLTDTISYKSLPTVNNNVKT